MKIENIRTALTNNLLVSISEPCDCGGQIRHNNGGNYHQIIEIKKGENDVLEFKFDDTCELTPDEPFYPEQGKDWVNVKEAIDAGWYVSVH